jgi:hypothetical protein
LDLSCYCYSDSQPHGKKSQYSEFGNSGGRIELGAYAPAVILSAAKNLIQSASARPLRREHAGREFVVVIWALQHG